MCKKIILILLSFLLVGCGTNINKMSLEEIIVDSIVSDNTYINDYWRGFKYYLPSEFTVYDDKDYIQTLLSKNKLETKHELDDFEYYTFNNKNKEGYLRITKNKEKFLVELCYNYAIIEVEVEESELRYAISRSIAILNSIQYNDLVIEKYIVDNNIENSETVYKIPQPENKESNKNVLEYIEENQVENADDLD